ncbi:hypothetical protein ACO1O0_004306 [Amphichorda felina]
MEAAAETVKQLTRTILPQRPHQLAPSLEWKCRPSPDDSRYHEEWQQVRLQYMTFLTDADRGTLFTRGYDDIRPEQLKPVPKEINALARGGTAKKLSLSDYKNKKMTGATASTSPLDSMSSQTPNKLIDRASVTPNPESWGAPDPKPTSDSARKSDGGKPPRSEPSSIGKQASAGESIVVDTRYPLKGSSMGSPRQPLAGCSLPPKPPSLPPKPPSPDSRKRPAELDDGTRPLKRAKPADIGRATDDRSRTSREDPTRRRPQDPPLSRDSRDSIHSKESRLLNSSSSFPNGRSALKAVTGLNRAESPPSRSRGNSVNGARPPGAEQNHVTLRKSDSSKAFVPPLLSPLHFDVEGNKGENEVRRIEKKRREEATETNRTMKTTKNFETQPSAKRSRSPARLPPLLSPTLPPEIEAELERRKKASPKSSEDRSKDMEALIQSKRAGTDTPSDDLAENKDRPSLIVTLKIPKSLRRDFRLLMKLTPRKEPVRSAAATGPAQPTRAEKRPVSSVEQSLEPSALKKRRISDVSGPTKGSVPPLTPSKKGSAAMSRVSSNNSMAHTPGEAMGATPSVPGFSDRAGHDRGPPSKTAEARVKALKEREDLLRNLGRKLKHKGDLALKGRGDSSAVTNGNTRQGEPSVKAGYALIIESVAAFMMGFHAQDVYRGMANKPSDPSSWNSLFPLIDMLQKEIRRYDTRRNTPVYALTLLLQVISWEQLLNAWATHEDPSDRVTVKQLLRAQRGRAKTWPLFRDATEDVDSALRVNVLPWTTVEDVVESTLRVLRRWCADEGVDWSPELNLRDSGIKTAGQT